VAGGRGPDLLSRQIESAMSEMLVSSRLLTREAQGLFRHLDIVNQAIDMLPDPEAQQLLYAWVLSTRRELLQTMHALSEQLQTRCGADRA